MNVTVVTTAGKDETALEVLALLGMPFKRDKKAAKKLHKPVVARFIGRLLGSIKELH
jgi:hypothetical protein